MDQLLEITAPVLGEIAGEDILDGIKDKTEISDLPIKDDIAVASVRQTYGEAKGRYYIMCVGGGIPTRPHGSRYYAEREAKRLAAKSPDKTFHVLKVKSSFSSSSTDIAIAEARLGLSIGQQVTISPFHFRNAQECGVIDAFTHDGAVTVTLESGAVYNFSPTSLLTRPKSAGAISHEQEPGG